MDGAHWRTLEEREWVGNKRGALRCSVPLMCFDMSFFLLPVFSGDFSGSVVEIMVYGVKDLLQEFILLRKDEVRVGYGQSGIL